MTASGSCSGQRRSRSRTPASRAPASNVVNPTIVPTAGRSPRVVNDIRQGWPAAPTAGTRDHHRQPQPDGHRPGGQVHPDARRRSRSPARRTDSDPATSCLIYLWEQNDLGTGAGSLNQPHATGPLFRVFGEYANVTAAGHDPVQLAGREPGDEQPDPDLPGHGAGPGRQHQRRDRPCATITETSSLPDAAKLGCHSEFLPDGDVQPRGRAPCTSGSPRATRSRPDGGTHSADVTVTLSPTHRPVPGDHARRPRSPTPATAPRRSRGTSNGTDAVALART